MGIVYHPPSADDPSMIHYLHESLTSIESQFPNSGTILLGDFNKLKVSRIKKCIIANEPPWMSLSLKRLIHSRQKAFTQGDPITFRSLRNQVNRERKRLRAKYYDAKVKQLRSCAPAIWWKEIKRLCGMSEQVGRREDTAAMLSNIEHNLDSSSPSLVELPNEINQEFLRPMSDFNPLLPSNRQADADGRSEGLCVSEFSVFKKLTALNQSKAGGPDGIPNWILKENADILATTKVEFRPHGNSQILFLYPKQNQCERLIKIYAQSPCHQSCRRLQKIMLSTSLSNQRS